MASANIYDRTTEPRTGRDHATHRRRIAGYAGDTFTKTSLA